MCCSRSKLAAIEQDGGVDGGLAGCRGSAGKATPARTRGGQVARGLGELIDGRAAAGEKAGLLKEVGGRIAADGEFGEDGEARAQVRGAAAGGNDFFEISGEIPDRGIDLGECDLHISSLIRRQRTS